VIIIIGCVSWFLGPCCYATEDLLDLLRAFYPVSKLDNCLTDTPTHTHTLTPDLRPSRVPYLCESSGVGESETGPVKYGAASLFRCIFPAVNLEKC
jgi:hypothetical protein